MYCQKLDSFGLHFWCRQCGSVFNEIDVVGFKC